MQPCPLYLSVLGYLNTTLTMEHARLQSSSKIYDSRTIRPRNVRCNVTNKHEPRGLLLSYEIIVIA